MHRDARLTTHVALAARALGASGFLLADTEDAKIEATLAKVSENWGGEFLFEMGRPWRKEIENWKTKGGITVHLTAYGENIQGTDVLKRIRKTDRDILLLVGSQKVPREFYTGEVSDFNVSVGNQPHSECAAIAIFLDRFFKGKELNKKFENAKMRIVPQERGKKILVKHVFPSKN
jgi:tRNA (cytidine56-2'-O)-methyltransferase